MSAFLSELGSRLADRWAAALLIPGLLYLGAVTLAVRLGQLHAVDFGRLSTWVTGLADGPVGRDNGTLLLVALGVLGASTASALLASALGKLTEMLWRAPGHRQPARAVRDWRLRRWNKADENVRDEELAILDEVEQKLRNDEFVERLAAPGLAEAKRCRDAISLLEPRHPTWIADRLRAADERILCTYDVDLRSAWPRLWSIASAELRSDLIATQDSYTAATRLVGWSVLYLVLACWWWPAAVIAVSTCCAGWARGRAAADILADLIETTADLHLRDLAERLGVPLEHGLTPVAGRTITSRLLKDPPRGFIYRNSDPPR